MLSAAVARDLPGPAGEAPRKNASSAAHDDCAERGGQAVLAALRSRRYWDVATGNYSIRQRPPSPATRRTGEWRPLIAERERLDRPPADVERGGPTDGVAADVLAVWDLVRADAGDEVSRHHRAGKGDQKGEAHESLLQRGWPQATLKRVGCQHSLILLQPLPLFLGAHLQCRAAPCCAGG